jgi:hypothetical protein
MSEEGGVMVKGAKERNERNKKVHELAGKNKQVDEKMVVDSLELISHLRKMGIKPRGFNILRISESKLKVKGPAVYQLTK